MKKTILFVIILLALSSYTYATDHSIAVDFAFKEQNTYPITGFNLYMDGTKVCSTDDTQARTMDCVFPAVPGDHIFTMTAQYIDDESKKSPDYKFGFMDKDNTPTILNIRTDAKVAASK